MIISLIAAMDRKQLIGDRNQLPWRLPADFAHFRSVTMGKPVLMGRKTYESIGKPLPGRKNIVLSTRHGLNLEGVDVASDLSHAIALASEAQELMVIGGSAVYALCLPIADKLYITQVEGVFEGDAWFPRVDWAKWQICSETVSEIDERNAYRCRFVTYEKNYQVTELVAQT